MYIHILVGGGLVAINFLFSQKYWELLLSSQLTNSYFSEGWPNHQPDIYIYIYGSFLKRGYPGTIIHLGLGFPIKKTIRLLGIPNLWTPTYIVVIVSIYYKIYIYIYVCI